MSHDAGKPRWQMNPDMHLPSRRPLPTWLEVTVCLIWDPAVLIVVGSGLPVAVKFATAITGSLWGLGALIIWRFPPSAVQRHGIISCWHNQRVSIGYSSLKTGLAAFTLAAAPVAYCLIWITDWAITSQRIVAIVVAAIILPGVLCCVQWYRLPHEQNPDEEATALRVGNNIYSGRDY
jgi:hypothetical protein